MLRFFYYRMEKRLGFILTLVALVMGAVTFAVLGGRTFGQSKLLLILLIFDVSLLFILAIFIVSRLVKIWLRYKNSGSRLHTRLMILFGALTVASSVAMGVFCVLFFHFGIQSWFSKEVSTGLNESLAVATAYFEEHKHAIKQDALLMARDMATNPQILKLPSAELNQYLDMMSGFRHLKEAIIFDEKRTILGRTDLTIALAFEPVAERAVIEADEGEIAFLTSDAQDRVRALVKISDGRYLYVGRFVDARVLEHLEKTKGVVQNYNTLDLAKGRFEVTFVLIFVVVGLLLLLAAVWAGLSLAGKLARPVDQLIQAVNAMREGNLTARVEESGTKDELGFLKRSFNLMAHQLESQKNTLEERRQFIESVLSGVSSGVMSVNSKGIVTLANKAALHLLPQEIGSPLSLPEMADLLSISPIEKEITVGPARYLIHVLGDPESGYVITFDNISDLVAAQQKAAWADVARRIAHEIKNPLTPIQLATERIYNKYAQQIQDKPFGECIQTILKYVEQIRCLIDEFSSFARMPTPKMEVKDMVRLSYHSFLIQQQAFPRIKFSFKAPPSPVLLLCDEHQIMQAMTNVLKNAIEALERVASPEISITLEEKKGRAYLLIQDNGPGFPGSSIESLTQPYVTIGKKGTGLGLAIVKKTIEDHQGELILENREGGCVIIALPCLA